MLRGSLAAALALFVVVSCDVYAQDSGQRPASWSPPSIRRNTRRKRRPNVSIETYVDIKNEAAVRDPVDYGGNYESEDSGWSLSLHVERGGMVTGSGFDAINGETNRRRSFVLKDATINGALLAGTKFYENGEQRRFEAVFVNRTVASGKNANEVTSRDTKFGIGFIETGTGSESRRRPGACSSNGRGR